MEIFESQNLQSSKQIAELNADLELARNENVKQRREFKHEITILKEKIVGKEEEVSGNVDRFSVKLLYSFFVFVE